MTSIKLTVSGASARAEVDGLLTSGMVGIPVTISYDSAWDGLTKALVCRGGSVIRTILDVGDAAAVPHECMIANATLQIGVEGRNADGTLVIPTIWARCGLICSGANAEADPSTDPTLPVWAQIQAMIGNLDDLNTQAKENLVAAINEALALGGGEVDPEAVQKIVEDYLAANPPTVTETDPTVPAWAKQPEKPSYTADEVGALSAETLPEAINTALAQAKASGEFDGADGKSAYQYAQEGGYAGTEAEFAEKLAQEQLTGTTDELTPAQVYDAVSAGIPVKVQYTDSTYGLLSFTAFNVAESLNVIVSQTIVYYNGVYILAELFGDKANNVWGFMATTLAQKTDIPSVLPNPNAITFTGAVTGSYDGSAPLSVKIPSAVTDAHINSLIDTKLGVIENGAY